MPPPSSGPPRSFSSYKPRGSYGGPSYKPRGSYGGSSYNSYQRPPGNRPQYSQQQLKERSAIPEQEWNVCWEFNSKRGCRRGSRCKWKHISYETEKPVCHPVTQEALNSETASGSAAVATEPSSAKPEAPAAAVATPEKADAKPATEQQKQGATDQTQAQSEDNKEAAGGTKLEAQKEVNGEKAGKIEPKNGNSAVGGGEAKPEEKPTKEEADKSKAETIAVE